MIIKIAAGVVQSMHFVKWRPKRKADDGGPGMH
jgi:hypothetical protein